MKKGFTLIELLVVISIISLFASIIIVSTDTARVKARVAEVQSGLNEFRTHAALYLDTNGDYFSGSDDLCDDSPTIIALQENHTVLCIYHMGTPPLYGVDIILPDGTHLCMDHENQTPTTTVGQTIGASDYTCG